MYKYLKYKKKYLELKNLLGGAAEIDLTNSNLEINCFKLADSNLILKDLVEEEELRTILRDKGDLIIRNFRERNNIETKELIKKTDISIDLNDEILEISKNIFSKDTINRNDLITLYYTLSKDVLHPNRKKKSYLINRDILYKNSRIIIKQYLSKLDNIDKYFDDNKFNIHLLDTHYLEKINLDKNSIVHVIGDIHGSLHSLISSIIKILDKTKEAFIDRENLILKENNYIVFTGDMVDYSYYGLEVLDIIIKLKLKNPNNVLIIDGNHEDFATFASYQLNQEIKNELEGDFSFFILYLLNIFPTVIFMSLGDRKYQFNHGAHPVVEKAINIKLKEFLDSDKQFYNLSKEGSNEGYYYIGRDYKWGDFNIEITRELPGRPNVNLEQTKQYLDYIGYDAILSGHQDTCPISVLPFNGFELIKDKNHEFSLSIIGKKDEDYNLLSFPGNENFYVSSLIGINNENYSINLLPKFKDIDRKEILNAEIYPKENEYKYNLSLSRINEREPRILALIQSQAGISIGKWINYYSVSTIY